jgi:hypothetical protein
LFLVFSDENIKFIQTVLFKYVNQCCAMYKKNEALKFTRTVVQKIIDLHDLSKLKWLRFIDEKSKRQEKQQNTANIPYKPMDGTGATYIRWGKTTCPGNMTELVYKGYAGGSHYNKQGAASSYLCLPEDPLWNVYEDGEQVAGTVYGAEYELHARNMDNFFGKTLLDADVPCCVCSTRRNSIMMIPARNQCYDGWTLEYHGYLTGGFDNHYASDFVCLDVEPETIAGSSENKNGKLFYFIEARCGSLKCPPYVNGRELTCAVCSKL